MKPELQKLQGNWNIVSLEVEGAKMALATFQGARIVVRGDAFTTFSMGASVEGVLALDDGATPKTLDLMFTEGPHAGSSSLAIYEVDGDAWKLCLCLAGGTRPTEFATRPGSGHALEILHRRPAPPVDETIDPPVAEAVEDDELPSPPVLTGFEGEWVLFTGVQDGQTFLPAFIKTGRRYVRGNETLVTFGGQVFLKATFTLDLSTTPKSIDYLLKAGPNEGKTVRGVFEMEGEKIRLCFAGPEMERPTDFSSEPGQGRTFTVWKRPG